MSGETIDLFADLFQGRYDAYGLGTEGGGCERVPDHLGTRQEYQRRISQHLAGAAPMGVYPLRDSLEVHWGCTDLDGGQPDWPNAVNLRGLLRQMGVNAWIERSRSKGWHVWTFAAEALPADTMRNALLAAHQLLGIPATEVNPKQTRLSGKGFGNYVRLPYPGALLGPLQRQMVVEPTDDGRSGKDRLEWDTFTRLAHASRSPRSAYERIVARWYTPEPEPEHVHIPPGDVELGDIVDRMGRSVFLAWKYGPRDRAQHDRSSTLMRLAYLCHEDGLAPNEALAVLIDLDRRLGKFAPRADGVEQLEKMVHRAYGRTSTL